MGTVELPWELWGKVFTYLCDFRDWGRMECVCRGFRSEMRRGPWTKVQNLSVRLEQSDAHYHVRVRKTKGAIEADQLISFSEVGVVREVAERATNLKQMSIDTSLSLLIEPQLQRCVNVIRALHFCTSKILCGLTCVLCTNVVDLTRVPLLDHPLADLINQFSRTLTDINLALVYRGSNVVLPSPLLSVCHAIGNCTFIEALENTEFGTCSSEAMMAMLRNKRALKVLKLSVGNFDTIQGVSDGLLASGSALTELHLEFESFGWTYPFLLYYWLFAQRDDHPLMTVTTLSLDDCDFRSPDQFFNALPNLSKLNITCSDHTSHELAKLTDLIVAFLRKYQATVGEPKQLRVEGEWPGFLEEQEVLAERVKERISCHSHFAQEQGRMQLTFQKANAVLELKKVENAMNT